MVFVVLGFSTSWFVHHVVVSCINLRVRSFSHMTSFKIHPECVQLVYFYWCSHFFVVIDIFFLCLNIAICIDPLLLVRIVIVRNCVVILFVGHWFFFVATWMTKEGHWKLWSHGWPKHAQQPRLDSDHPSDESHEVNSGSQESSGHMDDKKAYEEWAPSFHICVSEHVLHFMDDKK